MDLAMNIYQHVSKYLEKWEELRGGLEPFFIKNLENVQGDERDVIFIGTVYGPSEAGGQVMQRFGPINGASGKRRLNVLFTRARFQIITFSSMRSSDNRADESKNPGAWLFKKWLEYSATGVIDRAETTNCEPDSYLELYVIKQLISMGCEAVPQVGVTRFFH
ncbi:MAG: hypothetical protein HQM08_30765 [Candidatus Riflebacteria bacterium]|nr:hypothetical protein [Candidatus Riflebacteria bacterium]